MARTPSNMIPLGTPAPDFTLPDTVSDKTISLSSVSGNKATVIMFICNHCPFVKHVNAGIVALAKDYQDKGVSFVAISSNDVENYPEDSPKKMKETAAAEGYTFPYLYDETQEVAKAYDAACTPDFFVFDHDLKCTYRGQLDDARPGKMADVTGNDIRAALDAMLANEAVSKIQIPSMGCNIKWKV